MQILRLELLQAIHILQNPSSDDTVHMVKKVMFLKVQEKCFHKLDFWRFRICYRGTNS